MLAPSPPRPPDLSSAVMLCVEASSATRPLCFPLLAPGSDTSDLKTLANMNLFLVPLICLEVFADSCDATTWKRKTGSVASQPNYELLLNKKIVKYQTEKLLLELESNISST